MGNGNEVHEFAKSVGAYEPSPADEVYWKWKAIFKRSNYFLLRGCILIVKVSRISNPWWGVVKRHIDQLNSFDNYYVVLLVSAQEGWVFNKRQVNAQIASKKWKVAKDNNYKIGGKMPDANWFIGVNQFFMRAAFPPEMPTRESDSESK